jgi:hypothetical protein
MRLAVIVEDGEKRAAFSVPPAMSALWRRLEQSRHGLDDPVLTDGHRSYEELSGVIGMSRSFTVPTGLRC